MIIQLNINNNKIKPKWFKFITSKVQKIIGSNAINNIKKINKDEIPYAFEKINQHLLSWKILESHIPTYYKAKKNYYLEYKR